MSYPVAESTSHHEPPLSAALLFLRGCHEALSGTKNRTRTEGKRDSLIGNPCTVAKRQMIEKTSTYEILIGNEFHLQNVPIPLLSGCPILLALSDLGEVSGVCEARSLAGTGELGRKTDAQS